MTTLDPPSLDHVLRLARQLRPADQARLVAALDERAVTSAPVDDPRAVLARLRDDFRARGPVTPSMAEELAASRR